MPRSPLWLLVPLILLGAAEAQERSRRVPITLPETRPPPRTFLAEIERNHPLVGRMWSTVNKSFFNPASLGPALRRSDFVLLGEVHDNVDHHRLQAWMIRESAPAQQTRRRPAVVMEMIAEDQAADLNRFLAGRRSGRSSAGPEDLGRILKWEQRGWPAWRIYQPIAEAALELGLPIAPGDGTRERIRAVATSGLQAVAAGERARLGLDQPLEPARQQALLKELADSHCGALPERSLPNMADAQRLRDAILADQLLKFEPRRGAVLIAGNGHVRKDRGVPWFLARRAAGRSVLTVMLVEVAAGELEPESYVPRDPEGNPAVDFVWFTPRMARDDPCEAFKRSAPKPQN